MKPLVWLSFVCWDQGKAIHLFRRGSSFYTLTLDEAKRL